MKTINNTNNKVRYILNHRQEMKWWKPNEKVVDFNATACQIEELTFPTCKFSPCEPVKVRNMVSGEACEYELDSFIQWWSNLPLDKITDYHIFAAHGTRQLNQIDEYYFVKLPQNEEKAVTLWELAVYNEGTGELIAKETFSAINDALLFADHHLYEWRYSGDMTRQCIFKINGFDISRHFDFLNQNYVLQSVSRITDSFRVIFNTEPGEPEDADDKFVCCVCGKTHSKKNGMFKPAPARPNKDEEGENNHCCLECYEKYVLGMRVYEQRVFMCRHFTDMYDNLPQDKDEFRKMIYAFSMEDMDKIIREEELQELIGIQRRLIEISYKEAEERHAKEEARKARARERARERRAADKAAKLAAENNQ